MYVQEHHLSRDAQHVGAYVCYVPSFGIRIPEATSPIDPDSPSNTILYSPYSILYSWPLLTTMDERFN